jgi:hypothetical protein
VNGQSRVALNAHARRVLRQEGSIQVCVVIETKFAGKVEHSEIRLVTLTR